MIPGQVTFEWIAPSEARSFLVRVDPIPFAGTTAGQIVVSGDSRTATLSGLFLVSGARYQGVVWAFPNDVMTPDPLVGPFNIASDSVTFTAPGVPQDRQVQRDTIEQTIDQPGRVPPSPPYPRPGF